METLFYFLIAGAVLIGGGIYSNFLRSRHSPSFTLTPNCLLTRKPILFVTGPRSIFYFKNYWNFFPIFLAEHGYEVFHLRLPWTSPLDRHNRFTEFLKSQHHIGKSYHLVLDSLVYDEMKSLFINQRPEGVQSLTIVESEKQINSKNFYPNPYPTAYIEMRKTKAPFWLTISFCLHQILCKGCGSLTLGSLGYYDLANSQLLLDRAILLAEQDLCEN